MGMVERLGRGPGDLSGVAMLSVDVLGQAPSGESIERYTLRNANGLRADIMTYGATLMRLETPDRAARLGNIVLGFDQLAPYLQGTPYFGAIVGRYANRIAGGRFTLDGASFQLATNDGANHLHGGVRGFDKAVWRATPLAVGDSAGVLMQLVSPDGDEGYPGELGVDVSYILSGDNRLILIYRAETTKPTPINLTHHSYFNLSGATQESVESHELMIAADRYLPVDTTLIPTGALEPLADTVFDFRQSHRIGARIDAPHAQLLAAHGYDHTFVLNKSAPNALERAATLFEPQSGRVVDFWTSEPSLQFYSGNHLAAPRTGLCLEPQHFPDSPNQPSFPSTILRPGQTYFSRTEFRFGVR